MFRTSLIALLAVLGLSQAGNAFTTGQTLDANLMGADYIQRGQKPFDAVAESLDVNTDGAIDNVSIASDGLLKVTVNQQTLPLTIGGQGFAMPAGWRIAGFLSRSTPGFVLRNASTNQIGIWEVSVSGGAVVINQNYLLPNLSQDWEVVSGRSTQGTTKSLVIRNKVTGENGVWQFNSAGTLTAAAFLPTVPLDWTLVGTGNFGGSEQDQGDLLWRKSGTPEVATWTISGTQVEAFHMLPSVSPSWSIIEVLDLSGNGGSAIRWTNIPAPNQSPTITIWIAINNGRITITATEPRPVLAPAPTGT